MFCSNCGAKLADGTSFCPQCGTSVKQNTTVSGAYSQNSANNRAPVYSYNNQGSYSYNGNSQRPAAANAAGNPLFGILKKLGSSPLFAVCSSLFTLSLMLSFLYIVGGRSQIVGSIYRMIDQFGLADYLWYYLNPIYKAVTVYSFVSLIPGILIAAGLWMTFASAHNKYRPSVKTAGLTIIKVINCISLVWSCIVFAAVEILGTVALTGVIAAADNVYDSYYEYSNAYTLGFIIGFMITVAVVSVLAILFFAKINKTINSVKNVAINGSVKKLASTYVAVILIIYAVFYLIAAFAMLNNPIAAVQMVVACVMNICFAALIFSYNSKFRPFYGAQQNTYVYAPQAYNQYPQNSVPPMYNNTSAPTSEPRNLTAEQSEAPDTAQTQPQEQKNDGGDDNNAEE